MFSTAKSLDTKKTAAVKKTKDEHEISGICDLALLDALIKSATAMKESIETEVKTRGFEIFMESKGGTRPSSFVGVDGAATASVEMRKRGTNSKLTDDEAEVLRAQGIEPFKQIVTQELFAINPSYAADSKLLSKVEKALDKLDLPKDFIVKQEEVSKLVVSDEMLDTAFKDGTVSNAVLSIMTTMALKPKLGAQYDMSNLITDALNIMQPKKKSVVKLQTANKAA